jgi:hypothetical protein
MVETRLTREDRTRATLERPKSWQPAAGLPEPDREAGYDYRWVRVSAENEADPKNMSAKLREGWEPVRIEEQPRLRYLTDEGSRFKDNIEVGGLLLCKIPTEFMAQRRAHYGRVNEAQIESVDNSYMKEQDARMPLFKERRSTVSFGKGR